MPNSFMLYWGGKGFESSPLLPGMWSLSAFARIFCIEPELFEELKICNTTLYTFCGLTAMKIADLFERH